MVTRSSCATVFGRHQRGVLATELLVAVSLLTLALFPLALAFLNEQKLARAYYHRAVAMEVVDGEVEVLRAGAWRQYGEGTHRYRPRARAAVNLPPGRFELRIAPSHVRLDWIPERRDRGGRVHREVTLP